MKTIKIIFVITFALAGLTLSCESISNPDPINAIDSTQTATIQGTAYANMDETNDTTFSTKENYERAPQGTNVKVVLNSRDFASNIEPGVDYKSLTYETTVNSSGDYSIEVPALGDPIDAEIYFDSFKTSQTQVDSTEEQRNYSPQQFPYTVRISAGLSTFNDAIYNSN
ncbi:hypothetical protein [Fodinibius sp. Rm-B-1B1-1]|uniref:hypothetical protein n=1 Tax=Fodinibius alkaliphilus TaxID=3140241 RepID=UPI00315AA60F